MTLLVIHYIGDLEPKEITSCSWQEELMNLVLIVLIGIHLSITYPLVESILSVGWAICLSVKWQPKAVFAYDLELEAKNLGWVWG